jgi:hypothetical protein
MSDVYQVGPLSGQERIVLIKRLKLRGWTGVSISNDEWDEAYHSQYPYTILFPEVKAIGGNIVKFDCCEYENIYSVYDAIMVADQTSKQERIAFIKKLKLRDKASRKCIKMQQQTYLGDANNG